MSGERSYFLGTHDEELERLGLQHGVWRPTVLECWRRAGIRAGSRVVDIGAGPGFAAADLAEVVGPEGRVVALERSARFVEAGRAMLASRGHRNVEYHELDLMTDPLPAGGMDASWCRWVACFVASPALLLDKIAAVVRPGGVAIFHEYVEYDTLRLLPDGPRLREFVRQVEHGWREAGRGRDVPIDRLAYAALVYVGDSEQRARAGAEKLLWYITSNKVPPHFANPPGYVPVAANVRNLRGAENPLSAFSKRGSMTVQSAIAAGIMFAGTPDQAIDHYRQWAASGIQEMIVVVREWDEATVRLVGEQVIPALAAG